MHLRDDGCGGAQAEGFFVGGDDVEGLGGGVGEFAAVQDFVGNAFGEEGVAFGHGCVWAHGDISGHFRG